MSDYLVTEHAIERGKRLVKTVVRAALPGTPANQRRQRRITGQLAKLT